MTRAELCDAMKDDAPNVSGVLRRMSKPGRASPKRLYIVGYVHDHEGQRRYPRAVFDLGDKTDAPKPVSVSAEKNRRHRDAKKMRVNSVWQLGLTVKERLAL